MTTRQALHELVDDLPDGVLEEVERFLIEVAPAADGALTDEEFLRRLREAPADDEPLTDEDTAAIEEGMRSAREGKGISTAEMRRLISEQ